MTFKRIFMALLMTTGIYSTSAYSDYDSSGNGWDRSISLGLNGARGNSDTMQFRSTLRAEQIRDRDEWHILLDWAFGESDNEKNNEFGQILVERKWLMTDRQFIDAIFDIHYDATARTDYRIITGPAYGVFLVRRPERRFSVEAGPSYVREKQRQETEDYVAVRLAQKLEQRIGDNARIWQSLEYIPRVDDLDHYLLNAEIGIDTAITERAALELVLQDRYNSRPAENKKSNDLFMSASAKFAF